MNEQSKRKRKTATAPDKPAPENDTGHNHTSTLARTTTVEPDKSLVTLTNTPAPITASTDNGYTQPTGSEMTVLQESPEASSLANGAADPATTQRIESLERAVRDLIQYVEAGNRVSPNGGQQQGGLPELINNGLSFLNKLVGGEAPTGESMMQSRMMDLMFSHFQTLDRVVSNIYNVPPPAQHMIIKQ